MSDILDEAKRLLAEATPGPWEVIGGGLIRSDRARFFIAQAETLRAEVPGTANAALIARAPTLIAELSDELVAERKRSAAMRSELESIALVAQPGHAWPYDRVASFLAEMERGE